MKSRSVIVSALVAMLGVAGCQRDDGALSVVIPAPRQEVTGVAKATVLVDYSSTGAKILVEEGGPACAFVLPGVEGDFTDDHKGTLTIHTVGPRALRGLADIAACRMKSGNPEATASTIGAELSVSIAAAEDPAGKTIDLAAKAAKPHAATPAMSESAIESAQAEAVKAAAATAAAAPAPPAAAPGANGVVLPPSPGGATNVPPQPPGAAPALAPAAVGAQAAGAASSARTVPPAAPSAVGKAASPSALPGSASDGEVPDGTGVDQDKDPSYDDSPSDDEKAPAYTLEVAVTSAGRIGALQFDISHLGRSGGFIGRGDKIDYEALIADDALTAANYAGERVAKIGIISIPGVRTPTPLIRFGFRTRESLSPSSFQIEVSDASEAGEASEPIDPPPTIVITSVSRR